MRNLAALIGTAALFGLFACQPEPTAGVDEAVSTGAAEDEVSVADLSENEANTLAFEAAWEAGAPVTSSDLRLNDEDDRRWPEPISGSYEFRSGEVVQLGTNLYALISSGRASGGGDKGALAFHYLARTDDGFRRLDVNPIFIAGGVNGEPPTFEVRTDLTPAPAVIIHTRTVNGDVTCDEGEIVELTPSHPVQRAVEIPLARETSGDNAWAGALTPGSVGRDFTVQYSGASTAEAAWVLTDVGTYSVAGQPPLRGC